MFPGSSLSLTVHAPTSDLGAGLDARGQIGGTATSPLGHSSRCGRAPHRSQGEGGGPDETRTDSGLTRPPEPARSAAQATKRSAVRGTTEFALTPSHTVSPTLDQSPSLRERRRARVADAAVVATDGERSSRRAESHFARARWSQPS